MSWKNVGYMFSSLFTQYKVAKEYIFTKAIQKDKSNPVHWECLTLLLNNTNVLTKDI